MPSAPWTDLASLAWANLVHAGAPPRDPDGDRWWGDKPTWVTFTRPDEKSRQWSRDESDEAVSNAMCRGSPTAGFSPSPDALLPRDLVQGADHRIALTGPTPGDVAAAVKRLAAERQTVRLAADEAVALTPRLLRLARRPGQTADAYLAKLRGLIERALTTAPPEPKAASPRDTPTLARLHGMDEAVAWGTAVSRDIAAYTAGRLPWAAVDRGCLLSGPPGCGKTLFARALATSCGIPLITGSYAQWLGANGGHQGDMLKAMRRSFADAKARAPAIVFIDEVDSFSNRATVSHRYAEWDMQVVNALLAEIDGVEQREGVVLIAACNHPNKLDPALARSGRLDRHIRIRLPEPAALEGILREHLGKDLAAESLARAAVAAAGATGADCERIVRGARRRARDADRPMIMRDLIEEIGGGDDRTEAELWLGAIHEAGHAVAACVLYPGALQAVTLRAAGGAGGGILWTTPGGSLRAADVHSRLVCLLAGRAAEDVVLGIPSSGAGGGLDSDLARATALAMTAASAFGLDDERGLLWAGMPEGTTLPDMLARDPDLTARVRVTLDAAYRDALGLIRRSRGAVTTLARTLMEKRALDAAEVVAIVAPLLDAANSGDAP